jgi:hypothetical protein
MLSKKTERAVKGGFTVPEVATRVDFMSRFICGSQASKTAGHLSLGDLVIFSTEFRWKNWDMILKENPRLLKTFSDFSFQYPTTYLLSSVCIDRDTWDAFALASSPALDRAVRLLYAFIEVTNQDKLERGEQFTELIPMDIFANCVQLSNLELNRYILKSCGDRPSVSTLLNFPWDSACFRSMLMSPVYDAFKCCSFCDNLNATVSNEIGSLCGYRVTVNDLKGPCKVGEVIKPDRPVPITHPTYANMCVWCSKPERTVEANARMHYLPQSAKENFRNAIERGVELSSMKGSFVGYHLTEGEGNDEEQKNMVGWHSHVFIWPVGQISMWVPGLKKNERSKSITMSWMDYNVLCSCFKIVLKFNEAMKKGDDDCISIAKICELPFPLKLAYDRMGNIGRAAMCLQALILQHFALPEMLYVSWSGVEKAIKYDLKRSKNYAKEWKAEIWSQLHTFLTTWDYANTKYAANMQSGGALPVCEPWLIIGKWNKFGVIREATREEFVGKGLITRNNYGDLDSQLEFLVFEREQDY